MRFFYQEMTAVFLLAMILSALIGPKMLPFLIRLKQTVREDGPSTHLSKNGTPTMGGLIFLVAIFIIAVGFALINGFSEEWFFALAFVVLFGLVGFLDDYIKVVLKRSLGLRAYQKIILQVVFSVGLAIYHRNTSAMGSMLRIPFYPQGSLDLGRMYVPFVATVIVAVVNSVNLTDGLDGLASKVTLVAALFFAFAAGIQKHRALQMIMAATAGGCGGFLRVNRYPAKVFMGDVGSMALGGAIAAGAVISNTILFVPIVGFVYFMESLSVIIQVFSFKVFHKRVFRMSPLHHHFELCGWKETKVVAVFYFISLLLCVVGIMAL